MEGPGPHAPGDEHRKRREQQVWRHWARTVQQGCCCGCGGWGRAENHRGVGETGPFHCIYDYFTLRTSSRHQTALHCAVITSPWKRTKPGAVSPVMVGGNREQIRKAVRMPRVGGEGGGWAETLSRRKKKAVGFRVWRERPHTLRVDGEMWGGRETEAPVQCPSIDASRLPGGYCTKSRGCCFNSLCALASSPRCLCPLTGHTAATPEWSVVTQLLWVRPAVDVDNRLQQKQQPWAKPCGLWLCKHCSLSTCLPRFSQLKCPIKGTHCNLNPFEWKASQRLVSMSAFFGGSGNFHQSCWAS